MENTRFFDEGNGNKGQMRLENNRFIFSSPLKFKGISLQAEEIIRLNGQYNLYEITLNKDATILPPDNILPYDNFVIIIKQGVFGDKELTFSSDFIFESGEVPVITQTIDSFDVFNCLVTGGKKILTTTIQNFM